MTYYKVLNEDGSAYHGGSGKWHLPEGKCPGKWMPRIDNIEPCVRGYHGCAKEHLVKWLGPTIYELEYRDEPIRVDDNKVVGDQARLIHKFETWNERTARLFACDCAERTLHIIERDCPNERRCHDAIAVARRFAVGEATQEELAAAEAAAWAAWADTAKAAAWAAWATAWADTAKVATRAAGAVAWAARADTAKAAAWAAWATAWADTAKVATRAAGAVAWAARAAERKWQTARLFQYLRGEVG